jgi:hypothetical protein
MLRNIALQKKSLHPVRDSGRVTIAQHFKCWGVRSRIPSPCNGRLGADSPGCVVRFTDCLVDRQFPALKVLGYCHSSAIAD